MRPWIRPPTPPVMVMVMVKWRWRKGEETQFQRLGYTRTKSNMEYPKDVLEKVTQQRLKASFDKVDSPVISLGPCTQQSTLMPSVPLLPCHGTHFFWGAKTTFLKLTQCLQIGAETQKLRTVLSVVFKYFCFNPEPAGEMIQFDLRIFFKWIGSTTN